MMYVGAFFVDIAIFSKILSVNCGFYPFRNGITFFEILTLTPVLNFGFSIFLERFVIQYLFSHNYPTSI